MTETLAIALAQINPTVGDIDGNLDCILNARAEAAHSDRYDCTIVNDDLDKAVQETAQAAGIGL